MADKDLTYRLVIRDDGTPVLRKVAAEAEKTGAAVTAASTKAVSTTQFPMSPQMQANAAFWMGPGAKAQEESVKGVTGAIKEQAGEASKLERIYGRIERTLAAFVAIYIFREIAMGLSAVVKGGLEFNAVMEESKLGMAAIFMAQGQFIQSSGSALEGTDALNAAMQMSSKISKELQLDNLKTSATYQQLVKAYQQTIAPGLAVGFDPEQIRNYTVGMVQAASAMGLNLDMLAEETRSMLKGTITPRNTLIATALGIRNEDINKYKGDVDGLYKYVMGRLSAFGIAGEAVQMTWKGAMSNVKDIIQMALGEGFTNLFEYLKKEALKVQGYMVKWGAGGPQLDKEVTDVFKSVGQAIIEIIEGTKTWIASLSGLVPIFGLVYQILRSIFIVLNPIVEFFGTILSLVGYLASGITMVLKAINDLLTHSKALQVLFAAIVTIIVGSILGALFPVVAATASWIAALVGVLAVVGLIVKTFEYIGKGIDSLVDYASKGDVGTYVMGAGFVESETAINPAQEESIKFKARAIELDQKQKDALLKIVEITGELTEIDRRRMTALNEVTLLYKDSYAELYKQIDLINSGKFEMPEFEGGGNINFLEKQITDWDKLIEKVPKYAQDIADLPLEIQLAINKIAADWEKLELPAEWKNKYMAQIVEIAKEKITLRVSLEITNIDAQIASQNKAYGEQRRLVDEVTAAKMRQMELDHKMTPELMAAMERESTQRKKEITIQQNMEELGWISQIAAGKAYQAEFMGNIQAQIAAERDVLEAKILTSRAGLGVRTAEQEQAEAAERLKFELDAARRIQLDYLNHQSKIQPLMLSVATNLGDYREQAAIEMRIYQTKIETLAAAAGISIERMKEIAGLEGILTIYAKEDTLAKGMMKDATDRLDLESRLATATDNTAMSLEVQKTQAGLVVAEQERILRRVEESLAPYEALSEEQLAFLNNLRKILGLTKEVNTAEDARRRLELGFTQKKETLTFQSNITELTGDWNASKVIEGELLKLEKDRAIAIGGLSAEGKIYAEQAYQGKMAEIEAQRTFNIAKLEEIGMTKYAAKLHQDLADQYTNLIPNAIDASTNAFGSFIESIGDGTKSIGDSFRAFFDDLRKSFLKLWVDIAMTALKMQIMKSMGFEQNIGMNLVTAVVGGIAGGGAYNSYGINAGGDMGTGGFAVNLPGRAGGGPVSAGGSYWVGEKGPEEFRPSVSGSIVPNAGSGGPSKVTVQIINESGGDKLEATKSDIQFKPDEYIISVVLDAAQRNKMGFRDVMGGGR